MRLHLLAVIGIISSAPAFACEPDSQPSRIVEKYLEQLHPSNAKQDDVTYLKELLADSDSCADSYVLNVTLSKILAYFPEEYANAAAYQEAAFATGWGNAEQRSERLLLAAQGYAFSAMHDRAISLYEQVLERDGELPQYDEFLLVDLYAKIMDHAKAAIQADEYLERGRDVRNDYGRELFASIYLKTDQREKARSFLEELEHSTPPRRRSVIATYPKRAAERGIEGKCEVAFSVDQSGIPFDIKPTCTNDVFLEEAEEAVARARFEVRIVNGSPRERHGVGQIITFDLPD